ncbi:hypothetical protein RB195_005365 [Necator americanus]|uniref:Sulfatase N-terminal domain-containing protein n=1 Tax=Necator americanus TaxID=51031 RepID=A0ABR1BMG3_NECAM
MERSCNERHIEMLDYMEQFIHSYPGVPKIAQIWPTALAHGTLNDLFHSDTHFLSFFQKNREKLENAFVFFMGDHGPWVTKITTTFLGRYEANNPFLLVTIPKRYRNTEMHIQLKDKSHQLMTNFDLHATLMDILQIQPLSNFSDISYRDMQPYSKGSSLLRIWRGARNCRTLPIPPQYCLCQLKWTEVRRRILEIKLGVFLAENLNKLLKKERLDKKCIPQVHHSTLQVRVRKDTNNDLLYDVRVYLHPSHGLFSAHIRSKSGSFVMDSGFKREDQYGTQGRCIFGSIYEPICQCRGQKHQGLRNEITRNLCKAPDLNV